MEEVGLSTDLWVFGMSVFTCVIFTVTNKFILITRMFNWPTVLSVVGGTYGTYIFYLYMTDDMAVHVKQHFTFYRTWGSFNFWASWILPTLLCTFFDLMMESIRVLIFPNP